MFTKYLYSYLINMIYSSLDEDLSLFYFFQNSINRGATGSEVHYLIGIFSIE